MGISKRGADAIAVGGAIEGRWRGVRGKIVRGIRKRSNGSPASWVWTSVHLEYKNRQPEFT